MDTLVLEQETGQVMENGSAEESQVPRFCSTCFTDRVTVLGGGMVYCIDCGCTTECTSAGD